MCIQQITQSVTFKCRIRLSWLELAVQPDAWLSVSSLSIHSAAYCVCLCVIVSVCFIVESISPHVTVIIKTQMVDSQYAQFVFVCLCVCVFVILHHFYGVITAAQMPQLCHHVDMEVLMKTLLSEHLSGAECRQKMRKDTNVVQM